MSPDHYGELDDFKTSISDTLLWIQLIFTPSSQYETHMWRPSVALNDTSWDTQKAAWSNFAAIDQGLSAVICLLTSSDNQ